MIRGVSSPSRVIAADMLCAHGTACDDAGEGGDSFSYHQERTQLLLNTHVGVTFSGKSNTTFR